MNHSRQIAIRILELGLAFEEATAEARDTGNPQKRKRAITRQRQLGARIEELWWVLNQDESLTNDQAAEAAA